MHAVNRAPKSSDALPLLTAYMTPALVVNKRYIALPWAPRDSVIVFQEHLSLLSVELADVL